MTNPSVIAMKAFNVPPATGEKPKRAPGSRIPWIYAIGMLVVVAVNVVMIVFAVTTFRGLAVDKPYEKGLEFNRAIERAAMREVLGWQASLSLGSERVSVSMKDKSGAALTGLQVEVTLARPVEPVKLGPFNLAPEGAGKYGAAIQLPGLGQWDFILKASRDGDIFETTVRTIAK